MGELNEGDFELDGYVFGKEHPVRAVATEISDGGTRVQDSLNPVGDDRYFGRDYLTPPTWLLGLLISKGGIEEARPIMRELAAKLGKPSRVPGAYSVLRYKAAGVTSRVYGRARNPSSNLNRLWIGRYEGAFQFDTSDPFHYDDTLRSVTLSLVSPSSGGVVFPVRFPVRFASSGERVGLVEAYGDADTPVEATINGPVSDPVVTIGGHELVFTGSLAYDQSVTVNTRTKTITQSAGANLRLSRKSYLSKAVLPPGVSEVIFRGVDPTGTGSCTVSWYDAHYGF